MKQPIKKRSVIEWTELQNKMLKFAADKMGVSIPTYVKVVALKDATQVCSERASK
jgi:hypothetical protein